MMKLVEDKPVSLLGAFDDRPMDWAGIGLAVRRRALEAVALHMTARGLAADTKTQKAGNDDPSALEEL